MIDHSPLVVSHIYISIDHEILFKLLSSGIHTAGQGSRGGVSIGYS